MRLYTCGSQKVLKRRNTRYFCTMLVKSPDVIQKQILHSDKLEYLNKKFFDKQVHIVYRNRHHHFLFFLFLFFYGLGIISRGLVLRDKPQG